VFPRYQIFGFGLGVNRYSWLQNLAPRDRWFSGVVQSIFRYVEPFGHGSRVWQTDGHTDSQSDVLLPNATRCVAKNQHHFRHRYTNWRR